MNKTEPWRQLLLDAADYMETHGHCKGNFENTLGQVCFYGALKKVCGWDTETHNVLTPDEKILFMDAVCKVKLCFPGRDMVVWNDAPERTGEDVIAVMREVAMR